MRCRICWVLWIVLIVLKVCSPYSIQNPNLVLPDFNTSNSILAIADIHNYTVNANEIVDLTNNFESFYDEYKELTVDKRSSLSIDYLKDLYNKSPKSRIKVLDTMTYIVFNPKMTNDPDNDSKFIIDEWDFKYMKAVDDVSVAVPLTPEVVQSKKTGTAAVASSFGLAVYLKGTKTNSKSFGIDILFSTRWIHSQFSPIPAFGAAPVLEYVKSKSESFKVADAISVSATCNAENGHTVSQYLKIALTKFENVKVRQLTFDEKGQKWFADDWVDREEQFNPRASVACITGPPPPVYGYEISFP